MATTEGGSAGFCAFLAGSANESNLLRFEIGNIEFVCSFPDHAGPKPLIPQRQFHPVFSELAIFGKKLRAHFVGQHRIHVLIHDIFPGRPGHCRFSGSSLRALRRRALAGRNEKYES